jgi:DNA-binding transcriptional LysR family regulator
LRFAPKPDKDVRPLREGLIDLDVGVLGATGPEVRVQALFRDRFVGVARMEHPIFASAMTPERYAGFNHVVASRRGRLAGPVDEALARIGLQRKVVAIVPGFSAALAIAAASDLVALVTETAFETDVERRTTAPGRTMLAFDLPVATPAITVSQMWHPRFDADPAHRWLRRLMLTCCGRNG